MKYKTILFDIDGTLLDYEKAEQNALSKLFLKYNLEYSSEIRNIYCKINIKWWDLFEKGKVNSLELRSKRFEELFTVLGVTSLPGSEASSVYLKYLAEGNFLIDGALELLNTIKKLDSSIIMAIVTNGLKDVQYKRIDLSSLNKYFNKIFISDEIGHAKPSPKFFDHVFTNLENPDKDQTIIIGDSLNSDIAGGNNYGIDTCWYNSKMNTGSKVIPKFEISNLTDFLKIIE